ncbi:MAG TPA: cupin domain-containing protein [Candidatus Limnocylindrales bacterium]|nr:cupin domain-containing protein [Candidatus Limnocylindrales bacterium]
MARRVTPADWIVGTGQNADMERAIAVSKATVGSAGLYSSVVTTQPGGRTRIHHHGPCETSIYILSGQARFTWGPTGLDETLDAAAGDFVYIPAGEIHVEENASTDDELVVLLTRNCPDSLVVYVDGGPDGGSDTPAPC